MNQGMMKGHVNAGCLLFMPEHSPDQVQRDLVDALLYTQLAASKKHSRFESHLQWRQTWVAALIRFGGALGHHEVFNLPSNDLPNGMVWQWIEQHLPSFIPARFVEAMEETIWHSILLQPRQQAIEMLTRQAISTPHTPSTETRTVGLQFAVHHPSAGLCLIVLSFETRQTVGTDLLTTVLKREKIAGNVELAFYSIDLIEQLYARFREQIGQALEHRRAALICPLWEGEDVRPN